MSCGDSTILYLVNNDPKALIDFRTSLARLEFYFNNQFNYPVTILHENLTEDQQANIRKFSTSKLNFAKVEFDYKRSFNPQFRIGYLNLCRFFAGLVQDHPSLQQYKYYWRLDTDSYLLKPIGYDLFKFMSDKELEYGYLVIMQDGEHTTKGLWQATENFIKENDVTPVNTITYDGWQRKAYYNNFEIVKLDTLRNEGYQKYFKYLDSLDGYFQNRWGDHVTRYLGFKLFINDNKIYQFKDIGYQHYPWVQNG